MNQKTTPEGVTLCHGNLFELFFSIFWYVTDKRLFTKMPVALTYNENNPHLLPYLTHLNHNSLFYLEKYFNATTLKT